MIGSLEAEDEIFDNSPIIIKDKYAVSGSDMAQIGWVEVTTENGATGYLWYLKSEHETRLRFEDYLETAMIEAVPAESGSGVATQTANSQVGNKGSEGIFYVVNNRGNVWGGGNPTTLSDFDSIISRLDKQGSIEENVIFVNRAFSFDIDDMLAAQNSYGAGGTSYGLFNNDKDMALNLGFTGFRRGYDFYKSDWKYLNDPTMRGGLPTGASATGTVTGLLVPAGSTTVYDQILAILLLLKLNAITEGRLEVTDIVFRSELSDDVRFIYDITSASHNPFGNKGWWLESSTSITDIPKISKKEKIVKLVKNSDWCGCGLDWEEKSNKSSEILFTTEAEK